MDHKTNIGRIHPSFFKLSRIFSRFDKTFSKVGDVHLISPFFVLDYKFDEGVLYRDDKDVLYDFNKLIKKSYGSNLTRTDIKDSIAWGELNDRWSVMNIGVCILPDTDKGWDGSPNAIYYDNNAPGTVVSIQEQFWNKTALHGAWKLTDSDIAALGGRVTIPNLVDAMILYRDDKKKHDKIKDLIGKCV
jgi:hypothetical protein